MFDLVTTHLGLQPILKTVSAFRINSKHLELLASTSSQGKSTLGSFIYPRKDCLSNSGVSVLLCVFPAL